jgi:hypothetical protein
MTTPPVPTHITFKFRRDTATDWSTKNPILAAGEPGLETDTGKLKFGDGVSTWNALSYFTPTAPIQLARGTTEPDENVHATFYLQIVT